MIKKYDKIWENVVHLFLKYKKSKYQLPYHLYCDNIFTSLTLISKLENISILCTGIICENWID